jgi:hypothetical protein
MNSGITVSDHGRSRWTIRSRWRIRRSVNRGRMTMGKDVHFSASMKAKSKVKAGADHTPETNERAGAIFRLIVICGFTGEEAERIVDSGGDLSFLDPDRLEHARRNAKAFIKRCEAADRKRREAAAKEDGDGLPLGS